jgi:hypothetical protein
VVKKRLRVINGIQVDIASLLSISHKCIPGVCSRNMCCCSMYEICVDDRELERITGYIPDASEWARELRCESGFENIFDETGDGLYSIDTDENDLCVFAYAGVKNSVLCSLHTAALKLEMPPVVVKPVSCTTWPLAASDSNPRILSVAEDAFDFPCNAKKTDGLLDDGIACIIQEVYGEKFLKKVQDVSTY